MLSVNFSLFVFLITIRGVSCQKLTPVKKEESSLEDSTVTLSYTYSKQADSTDYFFWYRQHPGKPPEFLMSISGSNFKNTADSLKSDRRFSTDLTEEKHRVDLQISSAAVTDSAVYYCALPNQAGTKLYFSSGTKLTVESEEEFQPSYYKLGDDDTGKACLATGFSRYGATKNNSLFTKSEPGRISEDSLFNQVALISTPDEEQTCDETAGAQSDQCADSLEPDPMVNLVTMTTIGLRLLLLKTIVFNVLMTFRLWISQ